MEFERQLPTEQQDTADIVSGILAIQARYARRQRRPLGRGTHAKGVCVRGDVRDLRRRDDHRPCGAGGAARARAVRQAGDLPGHRPVRQRLVVRREGFEARRPRALVRGRGARRGRRSARDAPRLLDEQRADIPDQRRARLRGLHARGRGGRVPRAPAGAAVAVLQGHEGLRPDGRPRHAAEEYDPGSLPANPVLEHRAVPARARRGGEVLGDPGARQQRAARGQGPERAARRTAAPREPGRGAGQLRFRAAVARHVGG